MPHAYTSISDHTDAPVTHAFSRPLPPSRRLRLSATFPLLVVLALCVALAGAGGCRTVYYVQTPPPVYESFVFPNGMVLSAGTLDRAGALARIAVEASEAYYGGATPSSAAVAPDLDRQTAELAMDMFYDLSYAQGMGDVTVLFPIGKATLQPEARQKLRAFLSTVEGIGYGRPIHLLVIGSASAIGPRGINLDLSRRRVMAVEPLIRQSLAGQRHFVHPITNLGETYSPRNVPYAVHKQYQYAQVIAAMGP